MTVFSYAIKPEVPNPYLPNRHDIDIKSSRAPEEDVIWISVLACTGRWHDMDISPRVHRKWAWYGYQAYNKTCFNYMYCKAVLYFLRQWWTLRKQPINIEYYTGFSISGPVSFRVSHMRSRRQPRPNMGRGMIRGLIWNILCYNLFIIYVFNIGLISISCPLPVHARTDIHIMPSSGAREDWYPYHVLFRCTRGLDIDIMPFGKYGFGTSGFIAWAKSTIST